MKSDIKCPECNAPWGTISCPEEQPGCYVAHYGCTAQCTPNEPLPLRDGITVLGPDDPKSSYPEEGYGPV